MVDLSIAMLVYQRVTIKGYSWDIKNDGILYTMGYSMGYPLVNVYITM